MDEYREHVKKVQKALYQDAAFIQPDPYLAQRVLNTANKEGGMVMKRKMSIALILAIALMLSGAVAVAAALMNLHIEKAMDIAKDRGAFSEWTLEDKLALVQTMIEEDISLPEDKLRVLTDAAASGDEKNQAATALLVEIYGSEEHISHFTIASHDWGDPFLWTLEQKVWFWETLRAKGLYTGKIKYLLPEEHDLSKEQVVLLAKKAVQSAWQLSDEMMQSYDADVNFFTIDGTEAAPRWLVHLGYAYAEAAKYSVLLTRDGQITEDASLYVFTPEHQANQAQQPIINASPIETPLQKRMREADVLYLAAAAGQYHFLPDCPSVHGESMTATENNSAVLDAWQPCPYCVLLSDLWSVADKIHYGVMYGVLPTADVISEAQAAQAAEAYLRACGMDDLDGLVPSLRYGSRDGQPYYSVFFERMEREQLTPVYSVIVDAESGEIRTDDPKAHGNG